MAPVLGRAILLEASYYALPAVDPGPESPAALRNGWGDLAARGEHLFFFLFQKVFRPAMACGVSVCVVGPVTLCSPEVRSNIAPRTLRRPARRRRQLVLAGLSQPPGRCRQNSATEAPSGFCPRLSCRLNIKAATPETMAVA